MAERFVAARADLEFRAETGTAKANVESLRRDFHTATAGMSSDTLKLTVAQEKLDKALLRHGPASTQAKQAEVAYRREVESTTTQVRKQDVALDHHQRELSQTARGAIAGSGAMRGLGRSVAFASASFLGGAGLIYGIRQALGAASNLDEQTTKTEKVFGDASGEVIRFSRDALGLARDEALETASSIGALLRPLGVLPGEAAKVSVGLSRLGVDLSSFYNTPVADALAAIKSGLVGEVEPLRRYGVVLSEARVQQEALTESGKKSVKELTNEEKVRARVTLIYRDAKIAAGDYRDTIGGVANQEREAQKNWRNTQILLGQTLTPAYNDLLGKVNAYIGDADNQRRIQEQVNKAVRVGGQVASGLAEGLDLIKEAAEPVVDALGGIENAVQIALITGVVLKARRAAASFGLIATASAVTRSKVVADAAAMEIALDTATRPRVVPVTVVQRIGQYGAPIPGAAPTKGRTKIPYAVGLNPPTIVAAAVISSGGDSFAPGAYDPKQYPNIARLLAKVEAGGELTDNERSALAEFGGKSVSQLNAGQLARLNANLVGQATGLGGDRNRPYASRPRQTVKPKRTGSATPASTGDGLSPLQRLLLADQDPGNDLGDARALLSYYQKVVATGKLTGDDLFRAKQDVLAQEAKIQSILDGRAADAKAAADKRAATVKKQQDEAKRRREASERAAEKLSAEISRANTKSRANLVYDPISGFFESTKPNVNAAKAKSAKDGGPATAAEIQQAVSNALAQMIQIQQRYAPNFQTARLETHGYETVHELRRAVGAIEDVARRGGFPASAYSQTSAWTAGA